MGSSNKLFHVLQGRIPGLAEHTLDPKTPAPFLHADPWLLASLLQKAVRRGELAMARRAGHQLLNVDPTRLWRRVMVTALEDIGLGDPDCAVLLVGLAALPQARRLLGSNGAALDVALRLGCEAVKDRSGDGFGSIAREMALAVESHSLNDASTNARLAVLASSYLPWRRRLRAALLLAESDAMAAERALAFAPISEVFRAQGVPGELMDACEVYRFKARDPLAFFVPLAYGMWLGQGAPRATITHGLPAPGFIGELPDYTFDPIRTRLGRRAVDLWLRSYLEKPPFDARQVAIALWNMESGACARTLDWPLGREIKEQGAFADYAGRGVPLGGHEALMAWVAKEQSVLACARTAVWQSALRDETSRACQLPLAAE